MSEKIDHQTGAWRRSLKSVIYSPLSFSQNIHRELSSLVCDALTELGVSDQLLHDFDSHSTITIDMDEGPPINISLVDDRLFVWSFIPVGEDLLIDHAKSIMPIITTVVECVETGHLTLGKCSDGFELKALVNPRALVENKLNEILHGFHGALKIIDGCR
ncbi:InvB/SpaK family type III secretion system chaperone [Pseudomonas monteilii]|uniref:Uncharacterized protein n=1 Tax=Pseudomonas monteilii TaxID=76759 RepID=A0A399M924_9PSED|nr:hypothetical protein [Pseudomonas monteilii]RII78290.1 hypothetical protein D0894_08645 [Pseudomonas monteilii]